MRDRPNRVWYRSGGDRLKPVATVPQARRWTGLLVAGLLAACGQGASPGASPSSTPLPPNTGPVAAVTARAAVSPDAVPPTPVCSALAATPANGEGPYYKPGSPERTSLMEGDLAGVRLVIHGYVLSLVCQPIPDAWLDFWQADAGGAYDNAGYRLRGHQFSDEAGRYRLETILPAAYGSRPRHIHVKVQPAGGATLTTQLYFPSDPQVSSDPLFDPRLIVELTPDGDGFVGVFHFILGMGIAP